MSARDEFPDEVKHELAWRVGLRCSNPDCRQLCAGPTEDRNKVSNIGVAAHITAAGAGGPRFNPELSREKRRSADNGVWLCQNCAKLVDGDVQRYTVEYLLEWKRSGEAAARRELESPGGQRLRPELRLQVEHIQMDPRNNRILIPVRNFGQTIAHKVTIKFDCDQTAVHEQSRAEDVPPDGRDHLFSFDLFLPVPRGSAIERQCRELASSIQTGTKVLVFTIAGYYFGEGVRYDIPERYGVWSPTNGLQITLSRSASFSHEGRDNELND